MIFNAIAYPIIMAISNHRKIINPRNRKVSHLVLQIKSNDHRTCAQEVQHMYSQDYKHITVSKVTNNIIITRILSQTQDLLHRVFHDKTKRKSPSHMQLSVGM
jgi:hypothetical protein